MMKALVTAKVRMIKAVESLEARDERGQGSIEYVGAILIAAVLIGVVIKAVDALDLGTNVQEAVDKVFDN